MKNTKQSSRFSIFLFLAFCTFFNFNCIYAQDAPLVLNWDKTGCQQDGKDKINFDANFQTASCLKVCRNAIATYRLLGDGMPTVARVQWQVNGGELETNDEFSVIKWDDTDTGEINIKVVFLDSTVVQRAICIEKSASHLVLGWDRIGCQLEENNKSELKLGSNMATSDCLKVCKFGKPTYSLLGDDVDNIIAVRWTITGGIAETPYDLKTNIIWNSTINGNINVKVTFNNGSIEQKNICVNKINSSLLLDWEKIDESAIREIKVDNDQDNKEVLLVYEDSTVPYKVFGNKTSMIESVQWQVIGGVADNASGLTTAVTWFDQDDKKLMLHVNYLDGTSQDQEIAVLAMAKAGAGGGANAIPIADRITFAYDEMGNQRERKLCINCVRNRVRNEPKSVVNEPEEKIIEGKLTFYPNPVMEELHIDFDLTDEKKFIQMVELYALTGQQIAVFNNLEKTAGLIIPFSGYPQGIYLVNVTYNTGQVVDLKIQKK